MVLSIVVKAGGVSDNCCDHRSLNRGGLAIIVVIIVVKTGGGRDNGGDHHSLKMEGE